MSLRIWPHIANDWAIITCLLRQEKVWCLPREETLWEYKELLSTLGRCPARWLQRGCSPEVEQTTSVIAYTQLHPGLPVQIENIVKLWQ